MNISYIIYISIVINLLCLFIGFFIGTIFSNNNGVSTISSFKSKQTDNKKPSVQPIDETKFVVDIKTDGMEKKYSALGEVTKTEQNISESVNKLKNLKR